MDEARPQSDLVNFCIVTQIGGVFINARLVLPVLRDALLLFAGVRCGDAARTCAITWRAFCLRASRGRLGEVGRLVAAQEPMASCPAALTPSPRRETGYSAYARPTPRTAQRGPLQRVSGVGVDVHDLRQ